MSKKIIAALREAERELEDARSELKAHEALGHRHDPEWNRELDQLRSKVGEAFRSWRAEAQGLTTNELSNRVESDLTVQRPGLPTIDRSKQVTGEVVGGEPGQLASPGLIGHRASVRFPALQRDRGGLRCVHCAVQPVTGWLIGGR